MAAMSRAGVTSNAGFQAPTPGGATGAPEISVISPASRSSMGIPAPDGVARSTVENGAATTKGTPCSRASTAAW